MSLLSTWYALVIPMLVLLHLVVAPYTKVEESFNIQAIHDILRYGVPFENSTLKFKALFDHMTFSGSVPRTFIGALVIAGLSKPLVWFQGLDGLALQTAARGLLGALNAVALVTYIRSMSRAYGNQTAVWYTLFQASQFHVFFYASRTLPNMFAFCLSTFALSSFLPDALTSGGQVKRYRRGFYLLTFAAVIFRSEIALLIASHAGYEILKSGGFDNAYRLVRRIIFPSVFIAGIASITISAVIDSYFWQSDHIFLPELTAFWFNIFPKDHQGASAWGTSPWHWYFTSAIPRLILSPSLLLVSYGLLFTTQRQAILDALVPSLGYTVVYSILPHKETRFLFPIVPSLTLGAAIPTAYLSLRRDMIPKLITMTLISTSILVAFISHAILLPLSAQTYPGGHALKALHEYHSSHQNFQPSTQLPQLNVHLTNLALQSGITRFLEQPPTNLHIRAQFSHPQTQQWIYDKSPTPSFNTTSVETTNFWSEFDYVIIEPPSPAAPESWQRIASIPSLRRSSPRLLKPDQNRGCIVLRCPRQIDGGDPDADGLYRLLRMMYGAWIADLYGLVHDVLREGAWVGRDGRGLTRGYWIDWGLEERLVVLRRVDAGDGT